jgi:hypothetical protein
VNYILDADRDATWLLPWRELQERLYVLCHDRLCRNHDKQVLDEPFDVIARLFLRPLERVGTQIEQLGRVQRPFEPPSPASRPAIFGRAHFCAVCSAPIAL